MQLWQSYRDDMGCTTGPSMHAVEMGLWSRDPAVIGAGGCGTSVHVFPLCGSRAASNGTTQSRPVAVTRVLNTFIPLYQPCEMMEGNQ